jgi:hypothetical protein
MNNLKRKRPIRPLKVVVKRQSSRLLKLKSKNENENEVDDSLLQQNIEMDINIKIEESGEW